MTHPLSCKTKFNTFRFNRRDDSYMPAKKRDWQRPFLNSRVCDVCRIRREIPDQHVDYLVVTCMQNVVIGVFDIQIVIVYPNFKFTTLNSTLRNNNISTLGKVRSSSAQFDIKKSSTNFSITSARYQYIL